MLRARFWMIVAVVSLVALPLVGTAGYGLYLRSSWYAGRVAQRASAFLGAPVQIGEIVPLDGASQGFGDVAVWLPGEFNPLFTCRTAVVRVLDEKSIELDLRDGRIEARTDDWNRGTLGQLFSTAFGHDFTAIRLRTVHLSNMELVVRRGRAVLRASGASGQVDLSGPTAKLNVICDGLNGVRSAEPIRLACEVEPGARPLVRQVSLSVERLGIEAFLPKKNGLRVTGDGLREEKDGSRVSGLGAQGSELGARATTSTTTATTPATVAADQNGSAFGWFTGNIVYRQKEQGSLEGVVELAGQIQDVDLATVSGRVSKAALAGTVSGTLERAVLEAGELRAVTARLRIERLDLRGLLGLAGWPAAAGMAWLDLHELRCEGGRVQALLAEARVEGLEVGPLLAPLHIGTVTGQLDANVRKLKIVDNQVAELAGEARVRGPGGTGGTVDRSVLEAAAQRLLNITLPPVLPEKIPYSDLGARLHVEENELYVQGVAGPDEAFLLVADVAGMPMPLVPQPPVPIRLDDLREGLERQIGRFAHAATAWVQGRVSPMD